MRRVLVLMFWLLVWSSVHAQSLGRQPGGGPPPATLRVLVLNCAQLDPDFLRVAEDEAARVYRAAGVEILWMNAGPKGLAGDPVIDVTITLVSGEGTRLIARDLGEKVLGIAPTRPGLRGQLAYVFVDRVEAQARARRLPASASIGAVVAHELGHLLLPGGGHSAAGLMRSWWDPACGMQRLLPEQATQVRAQITVLVAARSLPD